MNKKFANLVFALSMITVSCAAFLMGQAAMPTAKGNVIKIKTIEELTTLLAKGDFVVVYFGSLSCGPCKTFYPIYEELARENPDVIFIEVTYGVVPNCELLLNKYAIRAFPTFIFFDKEGNKTNSFSGGSERTKGKIEQEIALLKTGKSKQSMVVSEVQPKGTRPPQPQQQSAQPNQPMSTGASSTTQPHAQPQQHAQPMQAKTKPTPSPKRKQVRRPRQQSQVTR